jgi:hypothetical protein
MRICPGEFVKNVERISRVRIVTGKEPKVIEPVDHS